MVTKSHKLLQIITVFAFFLIWWKYIANTTGRRNARPQRNARRTAGRTGAGRTAARANSRPVFFEDHSLTRIRQGQSCPGPIRRHSGLTGSVSVGGQSPAVFAETDGKTLGKVDHALARWLHVYGWHSQSGDVPKPAYLRVSGKAFGKTERI